MPRGATYAWNRALDFEGFGFLNLGEKGGPNSSAILVSGRNVRSAFLRQMGMSDEGFCVPDYEVQI
ncbi:MAG: hypothetical protein P4L46_10370 [Fimbriimonas sp.]|nr:hypothetical protein [Fimbriimonas sp.]